MSQIILVWLIKSGTNSYLIGANFTTIFCVDKRLWAQKLDKKSGCVRVSMPTLISNKHPLMWHLHYNPFTIVNFYVRRLIYQGAWIKAKKVLSKSKLQRWYLSGILTTIDIHWTWRSNVLHVWTLNKTLDSFCDGILFSILQATIQQMMCKQRSRHAHIYI